MYQILIAEDESIERRVLCCTIGRLFGQRCQCIEARTGSQAMDLLRVTDVHIAILDIQMPRYSGLEVARALRALGKPCVIIFLTAYDNFQYAKEAISLRALDYLLKPYDEQELVLTLEAAMALYDRLVSAGSTRGYFGSHLHGGAEETISDNLRHSQIREKIGVYLAQHYAEEISMQDVAQAMNYSDAYFCKLFKECFQVNFSAYLNEYRVEQAKRLLQDRSLGIRAVSLACGYSDANYFTRVFKRITNQTPSEYRANGG